MLCSRRFKKKHHELTDQENASQDPREISNIMPESRYKSLICPSISKLSSKPQSIFHPLAFLHFTVQTANMQFSVLHLLAVPFFISQAYACLTMNAVQFSDTVLSAQIHDNGDNTCNFPNSAATGVDGHYWFTCEDGFAAFLTSGLTTLAYSNHGTDFRWPVSVVSTQDECDPLTGSCGTSVRYVATGAC